MIINFQNVEEKIFYNIILQQKLPELKPIFAQWSLSKQDPKFKNLTQKILLSFLENITEEQKLIIELFFNSKITFESINTKIVENFVVELNDPIINNINNNYVICRNKDKLFISSWRI